jgi:Trk-type K+ transport system membrane component
MFIGRLGPLTLLLAMAGKTRQKKYSYPSENIIIG